MIYTVTLNPALDRAIKVENLLADDTTRVSSEKNYAAGKGIDVSRVIKELGGQSVALGLIGGYDGLHLEGLLINAGIMTQFTKISNETRTNIILREKSTGPEVTAAEIGQFYTSIIDIQDMGYLVMSGSLPRAVTPNIYGQLILAGRRKGAFIFLDADGDALAESIDYRPTGIKPNIHELSRLAGKNLKNESEILHACESIHKKGIPLILVSRGREGLLLSTEEEKIKAVAPPVEVESTVGAGDSALAGFVLEHSLGKDLSECVKIACAAGTATARTPGTELCHREEVERIMSSVEITML